MVTIDDELVAEHVITQAREYGVYEDVHDTAHEGPYGEHEYDTNWSLAELDPEECTVDVGGRTLTVCGEVTGTYAVQTAPARYNPPGKAHPADYENREITLMVHIEMDMGYLPEPIITVEQW